MRSNEKEISQWGVSWQMRSRSFALGGRWLHRMVRPGLAYVERVLLEICNQPKEVVLQQLLPREKLLRLAKACLGRDAPLGSRPPIHRNCSTLPEFCRRLCAIW